ncbi:POL3 protein, partial [Pseudoatta argentina]
QVRSNKLAERLRKANLKLQPDKCEFLRKEETDPQNIHAVENFPRSNDPKGIKQFLDLAGYYRRFIPVFSKTTRPLTNLLKKDINFEWSNAQEQAFVYLKISLCTILDHKPLNILLPLKQTTAIDVASAFVSDFICVYGTLRAILTDQDSYSRKFHIMQFRTITYHLQSNGSIERSHHVLSEYLKQYVDRNNEWNEHLKLATFSYNTSVHEDTKFTPHELVLGRTARILTSDLVLPNDLNET